MAKNDNQMSLGELAKEIERVKDRVINFHKYGMSRVGTRNDRAYIASQTAVSRVFRWKGKKNGKG